VTVLTVNGVRHALDADPTEPLLYVLRDYLRLNGAKYGCGRAQCGACTVLVDGSPAFACVTPLSALEGREVTTVEGLGTIGALGVVQEAFFKEQAAQCGYCTAGMIMRAEALLREIASPSEDDIRTAMEPGLCRCGAHMRILRAVQRAAKVMNGGTRERTGSAS
jgi:nicotinate dehydrogenase subunit A